MKLHSLTYLRKTTKAKDGVEGHLYLHQWPTGFQELVFTTTSVADQFLTKLNQAPIDGAQEEARPDQV